MDNCTLSPEGSIMRLNSLCKGVVLTLVAITCLAIAPPPCMADTADEATDIRDVGLPNYDESLENEQISQDSSNDSDAAAQSDDGIMVLSGNGTAAEMVSVASAEPDGTPAGGKCNKYNNYTGYDWCAYFVVWCARQAGVSDSVIPSSYLCTNLVSWYKSKGLWHGYSYTPKVGDLIFYSSTNGGSAAHVGLVTGVSDGYVHTKEGNVNSGKVGTFSNRKVGSNGFPAYSWYIIGYASPQYSSLPCLGGFIDVDYSTAHADDIVWLSSEGISTGWSETSGTKTFRPYETVARADMAAFLYRLAGSPSYTAPSASPFADVSTSTAHYKEICWLASEGISTGWTEANGSKTFRPYATVARADMAAFLYRLAGSPSCSVSGTPFSDCNSSTPHYREICWLASTGVSEGWNVSNGREFRPYATVARADMAAFLHRMKNKDLV